MAMNVTDIREWAARKIAPGAQQKPVAIAESIGDAANAPTLFEEEDIGWLPADAATLAQGNDYTPANRRKTVQRARIYYGRDAISRQTARLYTSYSIGRGMSIKARAVPTGDEDPSLTLDADDPAARELQKDADAFWEHPDNSYVFSFEAQHENSDKVIVDGELFFLLYPPMVDEEDAAETEEGDRITRVRLMDDCLQVTHIITNPEDASEPWYYLRQWSVNGEIEKRLYPDYRLFLRDERDDENNLRLPPVPKTGWDTEGVTVATTTFVRHVKMNTLGQRGNSTFLALMDWAKVNRQYLEDRATINRAHARFAWKRIVKGPASAVAAFGRRAASKIGGGPPGSMAVPPAPAGSTLTVNGGVDWESMNAQDGGKNAYAESRNFRLMSFAAAGFAEHYYGDGSMGTRATSKSMERPVELLLADYQTLWKQVYQSFFAFDLKARGRVYDAHAVWVDAPQILEDDTATVVNSYVSLVGVIPALGVDEVIIRLLNALGIDDPQDVLPKIKQKQQELWDFSLKLAALQAGVDATAGGDMADPAAAQQHIASLQQLLGFVTDPSVMSRMPGPKAGSQFGPPQSGQLLRPRIPTPPKLKPADAA